MGLENCRLPGFFHRHAVTLRSPCSILIEELAPQQAGRIIRDAAQPLIRRLAGLQLLGHQFVSGGSRTAAGRLAITVLSDVRLAPGPMLIGLVTIIRRGLLGTRIVRWVCVRVCIAGLRVIIAALRGCLGAVALRLVSSLLLRPIVAASARVSLIARALGLRFGGRTGIRLV
jgi:hypothetical protein